MDLTQKTINQVESLLRDGRISDEDAIEYCRAWNAGPHFTQAVVVRGRIRNMEPEQLWKLYPQEAETCNADKP